MRVLLVVLMLFYSLPQFCPKGADQDNRVDLVDAIQRVREVVRIGGALQKVSMIEGLTQAIATLKTLARNRPVIKSHHDMQHPADGPFLKIPFLVSDSYRLNADHYFSTIMPEVILFASVAPERIYHPPSVLGEPVIVGGPTGRNCIIGT